MASNPRLLLARSSIDGFGVSELEALVRQAESLREEVGLWQLSKVYTRRYYISKRSF